ncbi:Serine protease Do-like HtrA [Stieleria maiorica]|uniref:Serine protease Do-like HtrA n=1 Tax=Stieleria maiorica TaxID=2795974 RepID=A0A5B9MMI6_9BACT|nr:Serine protease Do-like HtrA [Stieleria maiorica]
MPREALGKLKSATVYIETDDGESIASGSGFVVSRRENRALVATNYHVVKPTLRRPDRSKIHVFLNSGMPEQFRLEAKLFSADYGDDLALLEVVSDRLPDPIVARTGTRMEETQRVFIAGFPFGELLGVDGQKPSITITAGSVSSVRLGRFGETAVIQLSGGIDPGNSGGPIIDSEGNLVAVSVAKIDRSSIGFGIPYWKLAELQQPYPRNPRVTYASENGTLACKAQLNLPEGMEVREAMRSNHLLAFRQASDEPLPKLLQGSTWLPLPQHNEPQRCQQGGPSSRAPWADVTARMPLSGIPGRGDLLVMQWQSTDPSGQLHFGRPFTITEQELTNPVPSSPVEQTASRSGDPRSAGGASGSMIDQLAGQSIPTVGQKPFALNALIRRVMRAGENRYLVVFTADGKLRCIDLQSEQIVAERDASKVDELASGEDEIIGFNRTERSLTRFSLPDLEIVATRPLEDEAVVRYARRGSKSSGSIVAIIQRSGSQKLACVQINPRSGRINRFDIDGERRIRGQAPKSLFDEMPMTDGFRVRSNDDGTLITMWISGNSKVGAHLLSKSRSRWKYTRLPKLAGYAVPSATGSLLCTSEAVLAADLTELHQAPISLPTTNEDYFMTVGEIVKASSQNPPLFTWQIASCSEATIHRTVVLDGDLSDPSVSRDDPAVVPLDERFQCLPEWNRLVVVPPGPSTQLRLIELGDALPNVRLASTEENADSPAAEPVEEAQQFRTWTAKEGGYRVQAKALAVAQGYVKLETANGREVVVQIEKLSTSDQQHLDQYRAVLEVKD